MENSITGQLLSNENGHLEKPHKIVSETLADGELIIYNLVNSLLEILT